MGARDTKAAGVLVALLAVVALARPAHEAPSVAALRTIAKRAPSKVAIALREGQPLDLNRATVDDLCLLPRIGRALALRIVERRNQRGPYRALAELDEIAGIGPNTLEILRPLVRISETAANSPP